MYALMYLQIKLRWEYCCSSQYADCCSFKEFWKMSGNNLNRKRNEIETPVQ
jgi:hypothetical protein